MWDPRLLATLWASTARYRDNFTFTYVPTCPPPYFSGRVMGSTEIVMSPAGLGNKTDCAGETSSNLHTAESGDAAEL
jgi:hypothetical protein